MLVMRSTGSYVTTSTLGESVQAFVPHALPPRDPALSVNRRSIAGVSHSTDSHSASAGAAAPKETFVEEFDVNDDDLSFE